MGKIEGISISNYGPLKEVTFGKTFSHQAQKPLTNMTTIIGPSGNGKSTIADVFGFIADCLETDVEAACDAGNRGGFEKIRSQGSDDAIKFEIYYRESSKTRPLTYELSIDIDKDGRPYVKEERLRQRVEKRGWPRSFLYLQNGKGFAFEGNDGGLDEKTGEFDGNKIQVELSDNRKLGVVTLGAMKQYSKIEKFLKFIKSWYLCYFAPDAARQIQTSAPQPYLDRTGSNLNNVAQYMYRENKQDFLKILSDIRSKIPGIERIEPLKMQNGQVVLQFWEKGFKEPFFSQKMSDGTLKLFAYYLLLHERNPRQLVFIEEPENGLYHHYLKGLAEEMRKEVGTGYSKQLFVTTHSPFFVNSLKPEEVWVLRKEENGFSTARRASEYEFVKELADEGVEIGNLWYDKYFG